MNQHEVDDLLDLFVHPGWKRLMDEMNDAADILIQNAWHSCTNEKQLFETKGRIQQMRLLLNYEATLKASIEEPEDA